VSLAARTDGSSREQTAFRPFAMAASVPWRPISGMPCAPSHPTKPVERRDRPSRPSSPIWRSPLRLLGQRGGLKHRTSMQIVLGPVITRNGRLCLRLPRRPRRLASRGYTYGSFFFFFFLGGFESRTPIRGNVEIELEHEKFGISARLSTVRCVCALTLDPRGRNIAVGNAPAERLRNSCGRDGCCIWIIHTSRHFYVEPASHRKFLEVAEAGAWNGSGSRHQTMSKN